jgi:hypothetical protein
MEPASRIVEREVVEDGRLELGGAAMRPRRICFSIRSAKQQPEPGGETLVVNNVPADDN